MDGFKDNSLSYMNIKTKNNSDPHGKPRVYFTCHPDDFDKYFDMICNAIFKTQDCAIYYTKDMNKPIPEKYKNTDLGSMNLFVVPITWKLLSKPNRAMDSDLAFAMKHNYPILPLMMESGIDEFYVQKFNKRQYLNPFSHDLTEISYEEKLKKYLDSVLLDNKTIECIRKAFDAYIFLSYRKKDRHHANELMKLIHNNPKYRDIAIWYDEYLTPGENFENVIMSAMNKSEIFTLIVTPNLINEENYVRSVEYKAARKIKKKILPIEMEETDHYILKKQFEDIPHCIDIKNSDEFDNSLLEILKEITLQDLNNNPKHIYYIGLAYLEGIDVEVNIKRGIELITSAAESKLPEAMETLHEMYFHGDKVNLDYNQALKWAKELTDYYAKKYGNEHKETLVWMNKQALCYLKLGSKNDCENALNIFTKIYQLQCNSLGEKNHITLLSLYNLAYSYSELGDYNKALELHLKCYKLRCEVLGEENPDTLSSLHNLAYNYSEIGNYKNEIDLEEKCYKLRCKILGEKHRDTLISLNSLAHSYGILGDYKNALELHIKCYKLQCEVLSDNHLDTIFSLSNIAYIYNNLGDYNKALELYSKCYKLRYEVLGENHPNTLISLNGLALSYGNIGNYAKQLELNKICYKLRCDILGEKHRDTLISLNNLAFSYDKLGNYNKALELNKKCYQLYIEILGEKHPNTLYSLSNLAYNYNEIRDYNTALELHLKCYKLRYEVLGEKHPSTLTSLNNLALTYSELEDYNMALKLMKQCYKIQCEILGEKHPNALLSLNNMASFYRKLCDYKKALELYSKCYLLQCECFGETHLDTLNTLSNIAFTYYKINNYEKALDLLIKCYISYYKTINEKHPSTTTIFKYISITYDKLEQQYKSTRQYEKYLKLSQKYYILLSEIKDFTLHKK